MKCRNYLSNKALRQIAVVETDFRRVPWHEGCVCGTF
jgi:hypothetical protein